MAVCPDQTATSCGGFLVKGNRHLTWRFSLKYLKKKILPREQYCGKYFYSWKVGINCFLGNIIGKDSIENHFQLITCVIKFQLLEIIAHYLISMFERFTPNCFVSAHELHLILAHDLLARMTQSPWLLYLLDLLWPCLILP